MTPENQDTPKKSKRGKRLARRDEMLEKRLAQIEEQQLKEMETLSLVEVHDEADLLPANCEGPVRVIQRSVGDRKDEALHAMFDAKPPGKIREEAEMLDLDRWSKVLSRLLTNKELKVDANISAMGILALMPVVTTER